MSRNSCQRWPRCRNDGVTLIEMVASLTLMSMLLVGMLLSMSTHRNQLEAADITLAAHEAVESLMADWLDSNDGIPINQTGECDHDEIEFYWETRVVSLDRQPKAQLFRLVRVELFDSEQQRRWISVDLLDSNPNTAGDADE